MNPYQVVKDFEAALCAYTGAKYAVTVNSCSNALLLCCDLCRVREVEIPKRTYISVPQSVIHAGGKVKWRNEIWSGMYQLKPWPVWDSARRFTSGMYEAGQFQCVSFHASKILADTQGGAILHDNDDANEWLRRARFDGRQEGVAPKDDEFPMVGRHCYMSNDVAARLLLKLHSLPRHNEDLPGDEYPDLSQVESLK